MKELLQRLRAQDNDRAARVEHEAQAHACAWNAARSVLRSRYAKSVDAIASGDG